jgi:hypothetical protein
MEETEQEPAIDWKERYDALNADFDTLKTQYNMVVDNYNVLKTIMQDAGINLFSQMLRLIRDTANRAADFQPVVKSDAQ